MKIYICKFRNHTRKAYKPISWIWNKDELPNYVLGALIHLLHLFIFCTYILLEARCMNSWTGGILKPGQGSGLIGAWLIGTRLIGARPIGACWLGEGTGEGWLLAPRRGPALGPWERDCICPTCPRFTIPAWGPKALAWSGEEVTVAGPNIKGKDTRGHQRCSTTTWYPLFFLPLYHHHGRWVAPGKWENRSKKNPCVEGWLSVDCSKGAAFIHGKPQTRNRSSTNGLAPMF